MNKIALIMMVFLPFYLFGQIGSTGRENKYEQHFHYNHVAIFGGASSVFETNKTHLTLGADYIRYFSPESDFAAGAYTEAIFTHHTEWLLGIVIFYGLTEHFWLRAGPGIEILQEDLECGCGTKSKTEFLFRIGAGYSIHLGVFSVDPSMDIDFLRSTTTLVWGVNVGWAF
jgi:hypothetical protein